MRERELGDGASRSRLETVERSATEGTDIVADTTDCVPTTDGAYIMQPDPPTCSLSVLCASGLLHL